MRQGLPLLRCYVSNLGGKAMHEFHALQRNSRPLWTTTIVLLAALGMLVSAPVSVRAQGACSDPANRTLNCDFATDISGWVPEIGSNFSHSPVGNVGPGSIEVQSALESPDDLAKINQCVGGLAGLSSVDVGASFRIAAGTPYGCGVEATKYSDDNCTTYMGLSGYYNAVSASSWSRIGGTRPRSDNQGHPDQPYLLLVDRGVFGPHRRHLSGRGRRRNHLQ